MKLKLNNRSVDYVADGFSGKRPIDIAADFLSEVRKHVWAELQQQYGIRLFSSYKKEMVVTVPAVWSERAKDHFLKALNRSNWDVSKLSMVTELEAAAMYSLNSLTKGTQKEIISIGDSFIL
jgi:molecular chaperone DnaK (HSP70)